jgi:hypothetical protein
MLDFHRRKSNWTVSDQDGGAGGNHSIMAANITKQTYKFRLGPWGLQQRPTPPRRTSRRRSPIKSRSSRRGEESSSGRSAPRPVSQVVKDQLAQFQTPSGNEGRTKSPHILISINQPSGDAPVTKDGQLGRTIMTADEVEQEPFRPSWAEKFDWVIQESLHDDPRIGFGDPFDASPFVAARRLHCLTYYCE